MLLCIVAWIQKKSDRHQWQALRAACARGQQEQGGVSMGWRAPCFVDGFFSGLFNAFQQGVSIVEMLDSHQQTIWIFNREFPRKYTIHGSYGTMVVENCSIRTTISFKKPWHWAKVDSGGLGIYYVTCPWSMAQRIVTHLWNVFVMCFLKWQISGYMYVRDRGIIHL